MWILDLLSRQGGAPTAKNLVRLQSVSNHWGNRARTLRRKSLIEKVDETLEIRA